MMIDVRGNQVKVKKDNTVKQDRYYCILGKRVSCLVVGSNVEILKRKCERIYDKGGVSFEPEPHLVERKITEVDIDDIPF